MSRFQWRFRMKSKTLDDKFSALFGNEDIQKLPVRRMMRNIQQ